MKRLLALFSAVSILVLLVGCSEGEKKSPAEVQRPTGVDAALTNATGGGNTAPQATTAVPGQTPSSPGRMAPMVGAPGMPGAPANGPR